MNKWHIDLLVPIESLSLSPRARHILASIDIKYLIELITLSEKELLNTKNMGKKTLAELKKSLAERGRELGMMIDPPVNREQIEYWRAYGDALYEKRFSPLCHAVCTACGQPIHTTVNSSLSPNKKQPMEHLLIDGHNTPYFE